MTLTIPISRFRRLLFAVLQAVVPARASAAAHAQLAQLYDRWSTAVFRAAYAYLRNKSDAEDVLQDPFLQYMRTSPELESSAHEKAWLLRVAINLSKNKLNSAWFKHTNALEESYPCDDLDSDLAFVWDAVRALPPKYREPIHLFYHEGYSAAEIARILGQKENTVRSLLHRGRSMLKETLKEAYDFDE
nr:sigma-70 family RNA polymerase sigma factor [Butyricicoccus sp. TM115-194]